MGNCFWLGITHKMLHVLSPCNLKRLVPFDLGNRSPKPHKNTAPRLLWPCRAELLPQRRHRARSPGCCAPATCIPGDILVLPTVPQPKQGAGWAHHSQGEHVGLVAQLRNLQNLPGCWRSGWRQTFYLLALLLLIGVGFVSELCCWLIALGNWQGKWDLTEWQGMANRNDKIILVVH